MQPARKLKPSAVKNITLFPSIKAYNGDPILVESILESKYCLHLEFDPRVKFYAPQPKTFRLVAFPDSDLFSQDSEYRPNFDEVTENKIKTVRYTPDFYVEYHDGRCAYIEVKPAFRASHNYYQQTFSIFRQCLAEEGIEFYLVDETFIYQQPLLSNYEKLFKYRKNDSSSMESLYESAKLLDGPTTLKSVFEKLSNTASQLDVYTWLSQGYLTFDIQNVDLNSKTEVAFNV